MTDRTHLWIRAECKPLERRTPLTPKGAKALIEAGYEITVERSPLRCFDDDEYNAAGCELADTGSWSDAPRDAIVLGLKELPDDTGPLPHSHVMFGHAYKGQEGGEELLSRFRDGGGTLYDLEYLTHHDGRRIAAFGHWAGYAGAAIALKCWCGQQLGDDPTVEALTPYATREDFIAEQQPVFAEAVTRAGRKPNMIVIGAKGRSGSGAVSLANTFVLDVTEWDMAETASGGPFDAILEHDMLVNCVLASPQIPVFVTPDMLTRDGRRLSVISDVSCDPTSSYNPLPIYTECTTFQHPVTRVTDNPEPLDLISIDHLPSLLPKESSEDYAAQLLPALMTIRNIDDDPWKKAREHFLKHTQLLARNGS